MSSYRPFDITVFAGHYMHHDDFHIHAVYCQSLRRERLSKKRYKAGYLNDPFGRQNRKELWRPIAF